MVATELTSSEYHGDDPRLSGALVSGYCIGLESSCPPEFAEVPIHELFANVDTRRQARVAETDEVLDAGFRPRTPTTPSPSGSGFESGGILDVCPPDGSLAGLADAATRDGRLAELDDDELIGVLRAWSRLESWCSSGTLTAIAELARRRPPGQAAPAPPGSFPDRPSEFTGDEVAAALTLTARTADGAVDLALDLATRLPGTARALHAGVIDHPRARLIADLTRVLSREDASQVEATILPSAGQQTTGQLRAALSRAVLAADPTAAARRREEAQKDPHVRRWQEDAGTAALAGFGLPPAEVLEADQRLTDRALALRDAGLPGALAELRARAYLDTLLGQDSAQHPAISPGDPPPGHRACGDPAPSDRATAGPAANDPAPGSRRSGHPADDHPATDNPTTNHPGRGYSVRRHRAPDPPAPDDPTPGRPRHLAARVNLTVPLLTQLGLATEPGHVAGFGPVDPGLARTDHAGGR
jgi:Domain of unknown function (DUF222)